MTGNNIGINAVINFIMGLSAHIGFKYTTQVHGSVAPVIHLSAKEGPEVLGEVVDEKDYEQLSNTMDVWNWMDHPNVAHFNLKKMYN